MEQVQTYDRWHMNSFYFAFIAIIGCMSAKAGVGINFLAFCHEVASFILRYLICTSESAQNASGGWPWQVFFSLQYLHERKIFYLNFFFCMIGGWGGWDQRACAVCKIPLPQLYPHVFSPLFSLPGYKFITSVGQ